MDTVPLMAAVNLQLQIMQSILSKFRLFIVNYIFNLILHVFFFVNSWPSLAI